MARKSKEYLNKLKEKYGVSELYSWSKYHSYKIDQFGWMLTYIKHIKQDRENIYTKLGSMSHDIIEDLYNNKIKYEDMINRYEKELQEIKDKGYKYNRKDDKANEKTAIKYESCMREFFKYHEKIQDKLMTEKFIDVKVSDEIVMQGYIDAIHKDNEGYYIVTDWKTSSMYVGEKINKEQGQLLLYSEGLIQKGVPLEKIKARWNFLKYCNIEYQLKRIDKETGLHKTKITKGERNSWVDKIKNNLKMWLKEEGYDELEIEDIVQTSIENNNLDNVSGDIRNRYKLSDCYVYINLTQENIDNLKEDIIETVKEIKDKENDYNEYIEQGDENEAEKLFWTEIDDTNSYYFNNLCGYSTKYHKPYKEYIDCLSIWSKDTKEDNKSNNNDLYDWLKDL